MSLDTMKTFKKTHLNSFHPSLKNTTHSLFKCFNSIIMILKYSGMLNLLKNHTVYAVRCYRKFINLCIVYWREKQWHTTFFRVHEILWNEFTKMEWNNTTVQRYNDIERMISAVHGIDLWSTNLQSFRSCNIFIAFFMLNR